MVGDGVPDDDAQALTFGVPRSGVGAVEGSHTLEMTKFDASSATPAWSGSVPSRRGYALSIDDDSGEP